MVSTWRLEYGGLKVDQARRLKELELENAKLKRWWRI
jgi:putative transposase